MRFHLFAASWERICVEFVHKAFGIDDKAFVCGSAYHPLVIARLDIKRQLASILAPQFAAAGNSGSYRRCFHVLQVHPRAYSRVSLWQQGLKCRYGGFFHQCH